MPPALSLEKFATLSTEDRQAMSIEERTSIITSLNEELAVANEKNRLRTALSTNFPEFSDLVTVVSCDEQVYNNLPVASVFTTNCGRKAKKQYMIQQPNGQKMALHISYKQLCIVGGYMRGAQSETWAEIDVEYRSHSHLWCFHTSNPGGGETKIDHGSTKAVFEEILQDLQSSGSGASQPSATTTNDDEVMTEAGRHAVENTGGDKLSCFLDIWLPKRVLEEEYYAEAYYYKYRDGPNVRQIIMQEMEEEED